MKVKELREFTDIELNAKIKDLKAELFNLRFSHATGQLANPTSLAKVKKDIARAKTIMKERELAKASKA